MHYVELVCAIILIGLMVNAFIRAKLIKPDVIKSEKCCNQADQIEENNNDKCNCCSK